MHFLEIFLDWTSPNLQRWCILGKGWNKLILGIKGQRWRSQHDRGLSGQRHRELDAVHQAVISSRMKLSAQTVCCKWISYCELLVNCEIVSVDDVTEGWVAAADYYSQCQCWWRDRRLSCSCWLLLPVLVLMAWQKVELQLLIIAPSVTVDVCFTGG